MLHHSASMNQKSSMFMIYTQETRVEEMKVLHDTQRGTHLPGYFGDESFFFVGDKRKVQNSWVNSLLRREERCPKYPLTKFMGIPGWGMSTPKADAS